MLSACSSASQSLVVNGNVQFDTTRIQTGTSAVNNVNSIFLRKPGFYKIDFNATVAGAGNVVLVLQSNGVTVPGAGV